MQLCDVWDYLNESSREELLKALVPMYIEYLLRTGDYADAAALATTSKKLLGDVADYLEIVASLGTIVEGLQGLDISTASEAALQNYVQQLQNLLAWLNKLNIPAQYKEPLRDTINQLINQLTDIIIAKRDYELLREATDKVNTVLGRLNDALRELNQGAIDKAIADLENVNVLAAQALAWLRDNAGKLSPGNAPVFKAMEDLLEITSAVASGLAAAFTAFREANKYLRSKAESEDDVLHNLEEAFAELGAGYGILLNTYARVNKLVSEIESLATPQLLESGPFSLLRSRPEILRGIVDAAENLKQLVSQLINTYYETISDLYEKAAKNKLIKEDIDKILRNYNVPIPQVKLSFVENIVSYYNGFLTLLDIAQAWLAKHGGILGKIGAVAEGLAKLFAGVPRALYELGELRLQQLKDIAAGRFREALRLEKQILESLVPRNIYDLIALAILIGATLGGALLSRAASTVAESTGITAGVLGAGRVLLRAGEYGFAVTLPELYILGKGLGLLLRGFKSATDRAEETIRAGLEELREIEERTPEARSVIQDIAVGGKEVEHVAPEELARFLAEKLFHGLPEEAKLAVARELAQTLEDYLAQGRDVFEALSELEGKEVIDVADLVHKLTEIEANEFAKIHAIVEKYAKLLEETKGREFTLPIRPEPVRAVEEALVTIEDVSKALDELRNALKKSDLEDILGERNAKEILSRIKELAKELRGERKALVKAKELAEMVQEVTREYEDAREAGEELKRVRKRVVKLAKKLGEKELAQEAKEATPTRLAEIIAELARKSSELGLRELRELEVTLKDINDRVFSPIVNKLLPMLGRLTRELGITENYAVELENGRLAIKKTYETVERLIKERLTELGNIVRAVTRILREEAENRVGSEEAAELARLAEKIREAYKETVRTYDVEPLVRALREAVDYLGEHGMVADIEEILSAIKNAPKDKDIQYMYDNIMKEASMYRLAEELLPKKLEETIAGARRVLAELSKELKRLGYGDVAKEIQGVFNRVLRETRSPEEAFAEAVGALEKEVREGKVSPEAAAKLEGTLEELAKQYKVGAKELAFIYEDLYRLAEEIKRLRLGQGLAFKYTAEIYGVKVRAASPEVVEAIARLLEEPNKRIVIRTEEGEYVVERYIRRTPSGFEITYQVRDPMGRYLRVTEEIRTYTVETPKGTETRQMITTLIDYDPELRSEPGRVAELAQVLEEAMKEDTVMGEPVARLLERVYVGSSDLGRPLEAAVTVTRSVVGLEPGVQELYRILPWLTRIVVPEDIASAIERVLGRIVPVSIGLEIGSKIIVPVPADKLSYDKIRDKLRPVTIRFGETKITLTLPVINVNGVDVVLVPVTKTVEEQVTVQKTVPKTTTVPVEIEVGKPGGEGGKPGAPSGFKLPAPPVLLGGVGAVGGGAVAPGAPQREVLVL